MCDAAIDIALVALAVPLSIAFVQIQWWCWSQVARDLHNQPPDITDGMPKWLSRRTVARRSGSAATTTDAPMLALPRAAAKDTE